MSSPKEFQLELFHGGLLQQLGRRSAFFELSGRGALRRAVAFVAVGWVPPMLAGIVARVTTGRWDPLLSHLELHVTAFAGVPLLLLAAVVVSEAGVARLQGTLSRARRLKGSLVVETLLLAAAAATTYHDTVVERSLVPIGIIGWASLPGVLVSRYIVYRWLWRWLVWALFLVRLSRLDLRLVATHPDRCAGLSELSVPSLAFALVIVGTGATIAARWGSRIVLEGATLHDFYGSLASFVVLALLLALGPLVAFTPALVRTKLSGQHEYGGLAQRYMSRFHEKWILGGGGGADPLGSSDIQSLADMGNSFEVVDQMRPFPFSGRTALGIAASAVLPMLPLILSEVPLDEFLEKVVKVFF